MEVAIDLNGEAVPILDDEAARSPLLWGRVARFDSRLLKVCT